MKALLYTRVSHEDQVKFGISLEAQLNDLKAYCKANKITIKKIYTDEGVSGAYLSKRKAFVEMVEEAESGDIILFTKLDRFSRNLLDANITVKQLDKKNVSIKAIYEDDIDTSTADGKFLFNLKLILAEQERDKTSERIKKVVEFKIKQGNVVSGTAPYGYMIKNKKMVINESEAERVRKLFDKFEKYQSVSICLEWWNNSYPDHLIRYTTIRDRIIQNSFYAGKHPSGLNDHFCEPIIEPERFKHIQSLLKRNRKWQKHNTVFLFNRLMICDCCGKRMTAANDRGKYKRYRCNNASRDHQCSNTRNIQEKKIEDVLLENIIAKTKGLELDLKLETKNTSAENYDKRIKNIEGKINRLKDLYIDGTINKDEFNDKYNSFNDELTYLKEIKNSENKQKQYTELMHVNLEELYSKLNRENKSAFWHKFVKEIRFDGENLEITYQ